MTSKQALFFALALTLGGASSAQAQVAHFVATSAPGDIVGQGTNWDLTFTPQNSLQFFGEGFNFPGGTTFAQFQFLSPDFSKQLTVDFGTEGLQQPLTAGTTYTDALPVTTVLDGRPNMEIVIDGRQPTTLTGSFTVTEINVKFNPATSFTDIIDLEANFVQYANGSNSPLTGTFTYHLNQSAVPEPTPMTAMGFGSLALALYRRRRARRS